MNGEFFHWIKKHWHTIASVGIAVATAVSFFACTVCTIIGYGLIAYSAYQTGNDVYHHRWKSAAWDAAGFAGHGFAAGARRVAARESRAAKTFADRASHTKIRRVRAENRVQRNAHYRKATHYRHVGEQGRRGLDIAHWAISTAKQTQSWR